MMWRTQPLEKDQKIEYAFFPSLLFTGRIHLGDPSDIDSMSDVCLIYVFMLLDPNWGHFYKLYLKLL